MSKIRKYFHNRHAAVIILQISHILGLISLPHFYKDFWKNKVHRVYSNIVSFFLFFSSTCWIVACFKYSITDPAECCSRLLEFVVLLLLTIQAFHFKFNLKNVLLINEFFEVTWRTHREVDVVLAHDRREKIYVFPLAAETAMTIIGVTLVYLLVPQTESQYLKMKTIYKLKHPENMLPVPPYIPFVDPSDPKCFIALYIWEVYLGILFSVEAYIGIYIYILIPHNFKMLYDVLNKYASAVGRDHLDEKGARVFYTNISRRETVKADLFGGNIQLGRAAKDVLFGHYEYFYLKKIVQFEQDLRKIRGKYESHIRIDYAILNIVFLSGFCMTLYAFFMPGLLSPPEKRKLMGEISLIFIAFASVYFMGEMYASCNVSLKRGLMNSHWYKCSRKTQKMIPLIMPVNQTNRYITVAGLLPFGYKSMVSILKTGYSVFNLLRIQSGKKQLVV